MTPTLYIIKIGGNVVDNKDLLNQFTNDFASIDGLKILVHGGGKLASELSAKMGIVPQMIDGRRITDEATLDIVTMVYAGLINKKVVALLQSKNCNAIGLTGADGNILPAHKRAVGQIDYGFVGDIDPDSLKSETLKDLLKQGLVPIIAPITHDEKGQLLNTNADTIASALAVSLSRDFTVNLVYCFEKEGVMHDLNNSDSLIRHISQKEYLSLKEEGVINKGMIPKIDNSFEAINKGVNSVWIGHAANLKNMIEGKENAGSKLSK